MEELFVVLLQFAFELLLEVACNLPLAWATKKQAATPAPPKKSRSWGLLFWFFGGVVLGIFSIVVFGHSLIKVPALRLANVILAPITSAYFSEAMAKSRARQFVVDVIPRHPFWQAFCFTLGMVLVRYFCTSTT